MENWQVVLYLFFAAALHTGVVSMFDVAMAPGQFMDWYRGKLAQWALQRAWRDFQPGEMESMVEIAGRLKGEERGNYYIGYAIQKKLFLFKVLGGCMYCSNLWAALLGCWVWALVFGVGWWCLCVPVLAAFMFRLVQVREN